DVGGAAQRDDAREADLRALGPVEDRAADRARLRDEGKPPRQRGVARERGVEARVGAHDAQAVWPEDANATARRRLEHPRLQRLAFRPRLAEAARQDDGRL